MFQRHPIQNNALMLVTTNVAKRRNIFADLICARHAIDTLYRIQSVQPFLLFGFVIMPDHCHLLLNMAVPHRISSMIRSYKLTVGYDMGLKGQLWQSRFHIRFPDNGGKALEYIHLNPVRAGLADTVESYPWSSGSGKWDVSCLPIF